jgi:predicted nuclease of predicted toxin-antitoxin system
MKLLFDQNLSPKLAQLLADVFPDSSHVYLVGLGEQPDPVIWEFAEDHGYVIVTKDSDFSDYSSAFGYPPHVDHVQTGNCATSVVETLLRKNEDSIRRMVTVGDTGTLALY